MIQQGFTVGNHKWYVMCIYDITSKQDREKAVELLLTSGYPSDDIDKTLSVLSEDNCGFTFSDLNERFSVIIISHATSAEQMYDTIQHELKHVVEHISDYYDVDPKSEASAYLQGEIARNMFPVATFLVCPKCD